MAQPSSTPSERPADARPRGVTLLAILAAISGVLAILGAIALMPRFVGAGAVELVLAVMTLGFGLLYVVLAYGLWTLKPWAWTLGIGLSAGSIVLTIVNLTQGMQYPVGAIISVAISAAVIYYLFIPATRRAFGKA